MNRLFKPIADTQDIGKADYLKYPPHPICRPCQPHFATNLKDFPVRIQDRAYSRARDEGHSREIDHNSVFSLSQEAPQGAVQISRRVGINFTFDLKHSDVVLKGPC
jgi:hypothetical protein